MVLTSRERVLCALNHEEPDRVPLFIGTSGATTLLAPAVRKPQIAPRCEKRDSTTLPFSSIRPHGRSDT